LLKIKSRQLIFLLLIILLFFHIPDVHPSRSLFDRFSEGERFWLANYHMSPIIINLTSGKIKEIRREGQHIHWFLEGQALSQYLNITEEKEWRYDEENVSESIRWYLVDRSRRINGTDRRVLWWIDTDIRVEDEIKILNNSFTVVGKGVQELPNFSGAVRVCWILSQDNILAYYDTEYGLLITLINITQVEGNVARGALIYFTSPGGSPEVERISSKSMEAYFYTSFPPIITLIILSSVFILTKYHLIRRVKLWLRRGRR